jgi:hypothetical protein
MRSRVPCPVGGSGARNPVGGRAHVVPSAAARTQSRWRPRARNPAGGRAHAVRRWPRSRRAAANPAPGGAPSALRGNLWTTVKFCHTHPVYSPHPVTGVGTVTDATTPTKRRATAGKHCEQDRCRQPLAAEAAPGVETAPASGVPRQHRPLRRVRRPGPAPPAPRQAARASTARRPATAAGRAAGTRWCTSAARTAAAVHSCRRLSRERAASRASWVAVTSAAASRR